MRNSKNVHASSHRKLNWKAIDWKTVEQKVRELQVRIAKAVRELEQPGHLKAKVA